MDNPGRIMRGLELNLELSKEVWAGLLRDVNKLSLLTKMRFLQFKLLHKKFVTNIKLNQWSSEISPNCFYCNVQLQTMLHLFVECTRVKTLWHNLECWIKYVFKCDIKLTPHLIIYNNYIGPYKAVFNSIILIVKQYIYSNKCLKIPINFREMLSKIYEAERIEARIVNNQMFYNKHYRKWYYIITS